MLFSVVSSGNYLPYLYQFIFILINPFLSIWYAIYEIEFDEGGKLRNGLVISNDKYLQEETEVKLYEIGYKLYFAINN